MTGKPLFKTPSLSKPDPYNKDLLKCCMVRAEEISKCHIRRVADAHVQCKGRTCNTPVTLPCNGRPTKITPSTRRIIVWKVIRNPRLMSRKSRPVFMDSMGTMFSRYVRPKQNFFTWMRDIIFVEKSSIKTVAFLRIMFLQPLDEDDLSSLIELGSLSCTSTFYKEITHL